METLTESSLNASSPGDGRKSEMTSRFPSGSSVYLIFTLIDLFPFPPVAGTNNADGGSPICKSDGENTVTNLSKAIVSFFCPTVGEVLGYDTLGISEGVLRLCE